VIYLPNAPPANGDDPVTKYISYWFIVAIIYSRAVYSTNTFKLSYSLHHTQLFLDQAHGNTISGFVPNALGPDPNWGKCLQCASVDRSRYKLNPMLPRSDICSKCFSQYCFDPQNPPSKNQLPGRKTAFKDPDPQSGFDKVKSLAGKIKYPLIAVAVGTLVVIGALIAFCVARRKKRARTAAYKRVMHDDYAAYELPEHGVGGVRR
jgi:lysophospholipase